MKPIFALLILPLFSIIATAQSSNIPTEKIDALFTALTPNAPGAAILIIQNEKTIYKKGYGVTDLRTHHPINAETNFRLASFTKQFTAAAIMLLVKDGKLHYDDHLTKIFPDFPAYGKPITIRHLLTHTSGLPDYEDLMTRQYPEAKSEVVSKTIPQIHDAGVLDLLKKESTPKFPAGTKWEYSNSAYCVLAMVIEKISGHSYADFLHDRIFAPLHMDHTVAYVKHKNEPTNRAYGHTKNAQGAWEETDQSPTSATLGDGGIYTSLNDLEHWDAALRNHTLLTAEEMKPALTPVELTTGPPKYDNGYPIRYGFGWFLDPHNNHPRMYHDGETIGFRTTIQRFPEDHLTVIVLSNRADTNAEDLALKAADLYLK